MIDFNLLDLSNKADVLKCIREFAHFLSNIQWLLFILVIILGVFLGVYLFQILFGGGRI